MAIEFITHTIPEELERPSELSEQERIRISERISKANQKLRLRMQAIEKLEKQNWQLNMRRS